MIKKPPVISVVITSYNSKEVVSSCLESLRHQETDESFEVIVVDSSDDGTGKIILDNFPEVQLHVFPERKYNGDARNFGVTAAKGNIIAFIDADCVADKHWISTLVKAHQLPVLAIGGSISNGNPQSYTGWAAYFTEFSQWIPQPSSVWLNDIASANVSYKKAAFALFGRFIEGTYCSDTEFHWRLNRKGHLLLFDPAVKVAHNNITSLKKIFSHEFVHGRFFGRVRARYQRFSPARRLFYAVFFPLIALKLLFRALGRNLKNRIYLGRFFLSLPLVMVGIFLWSFGECVGYLEFKK